MTSTRPDPIELGDISLAVLPNHRVQVTVENPRGRGTLTVAGAREAVAWLQAWITSEEVPHD